jgi:hypothetical protein
LLTDQSGSYIVQERYDLATLNPAADNDTIQDGTTNFPMGSDSFISFDEKNPFSESNY